MAESLLAKVGVFANLSEEALQRLQRGTATLEPPSGTRLFAQGDRADAVYAIVGGEGRVETGAANDRHDKRLMIEVFWSGDIFGEIGVIDPGPRSANAITDGRVRLLRIPATTFVSALNDFPQLGANISRLLAHRLRRTFGLFQDRTFESLNVVLARQILYLAEQHGRKTDHGVVLSSRLRQNDLANLLGATTRSIITILNKWRKDRVVYYDSDRAQLTILDKDKLQAVVDGGRDVKHFT